MITSLLITPIIGIILILVLKDERKIREIGLLTAMIEIILGIILYILYDENTGNFQFVETKEWLFNISFGVDGISLYLILLTTILIPICLLTNINKLIKEFNICILIIESLIIGVFTSLDVLSFYILFEAILIPMFLIIGIWGSRERKILAAYQFFIYTLFGSLVMLLAIIYIITETGTSDVQLLMGMNIKNDKLIFLAFLASFAIKIPMIPVHLWLPEAHVEAPTAGSVLLAGILLKLGSYGIIRYLVMMLPEASKYYSPLIAVLSVIGIIYSSFTTIRQIDLKKIIAYSSVAHMNYVTLGLFTNSFQALQGAMYLMLSHGLVSSGLFLLVGFLYDRHKTRIIKYYRGLTIFMPIFAIIFLFFTFANMSLPGTASFVSEFLVLVGTFYYNTFLTILATTAVILGAVYSMWLYNRISFGLPSIYIKKYNDLTKREFSILLPLILLTLILGVYPTIIQNTLSYPIALICLS